MVMGVSPILVLFGAIYHWLPKMTGKMYNTTLARIHFWLTFLSTYAIYLPMHYMGIMGIPRRYYAFGGDEFVPTSVDALNVGITLSTVFLAIVQLLFIANLIWTLRKGKPAGDNPWQATTLEWQTPDTPPKHGNWGPKLPEVYRWAYDYSVPHVELDFIPQNEPHHGHDSVDSHDAEAVAETTGKHKI